MEREKDRGGHTWLVHTLLNVTKAKVCANMVEARSFFARSSGRAIAERNSCGMKARDSRLMEVEVGFGEVGLGIEEER